MKLSPIPRLRCALTLSVLGLLIVSAHAEPVDFTQFEVESFPLTSGFPEAFWSVTPTEAMIDDDSNANASANVFYGPDSALGKRFVGQLYPGPRDAGADDDVIGFVLGFEPGDADLSGDLDANYLLLDWKGVDQSFNFEDAPGGDFFHGATLGGPMPAGLALSQVHGVPTADELWQHVDSEDGIDGGVTELARANSLGSTGYNRSATAEPYTFDISYTANRVAVIVNGVVELDESGDFGDGRFGLYTAWQGPTPVFANFEVTDEVVFPAVAPEATIDRATGELIVSNSGADGSLFERYMMESAAGSLDPPSWTSITGNYDDGGPSSVDGDAWGVDASTATTLAESEVAGTDGATLAVGQEISLGNVWTPSRFEDVTLVFESPNGILLPVNPSFTGNGDQPFERSDLNTDGVVDESDWLLFFPHSLAEFDGMTLAQAALLGDLDGDLDNDVVDFGLFKTDFDLAQGAGAFAAMVENVPEPTAALLMLVGVIAMAWRRPRRSAAMTVIALALLLPCAEPAAAQMFDFTEFTLERFPPTTFEEANWDIFEDSATVLGNANPSVLYSPTNVLGKRIRGILNPSTDDDVVGLVLGFQPGDASFGDESADANYLLVDWKGVDQNFDFDDPADPDPEFNNLTGSGPMPAGLALSRVTGLANSDELWQHQNLAGNTLGGVEELGRGLTRGFTGYDRSSLEVEFDILYTAQNVVVLVDGEIEFFESGSFTDGRFGLYTGWQSGGPTFSEFELLDSSTLDLSSLVVLADVNRETGDIVLANNTGSAVEFDFYQFESELGSLSPNWEGLADAESGADAAEGVAWVEAGGADAGSIGELYLTDANGDLSGLSLGNGESVTFSGAYNTALNAEDLSFSFRSPDGTMSRGLVTYSGDAPEPIGGDCNGDGVVDAGDLQCVATIEARDVVLGALNTLPGDLDGNGDVAFADFLVLSGNFGDPTKTAYTDGNIDLENGVAFSDFLVLSGNFGSTPAGVAAAVPEPSGLQLLGMLGLCMCLARPRR